ncbi:MAG: ABC transporter permease [Sedimentisphaerales bacterium]|nr:ABC transporter permease [Sedimentisphaerales bacterium]
MKAGTFKISWRNIGRNKKRTALALLAIAVGQFALLATNSIMRGYSDNIRLAITGPMIGHVQVHEPNWTEERAIDLYLDDVDEMITEIQKDESVNSAAARLYAPVLVAPQEEAFIASVVGIQVEAESKAYGLLSGFDEQLEKRKVLIGHRLAKKINAEPGQEIAVIGQAADGSLANDLYIIQDIIKCPVDLINQSGIVMSLDDAQELFVMPNEAHEIVIRNKIAGQSEAVADRLKKLPILDNTEIKPWQEIVPELVLILKYSDYTGYFVLFIIFFAAIAGIANTLMMSTFERFHEFGMLLALGSSPYRLVRMIIFEAVLIGLIGVLLGTVFGFTFVAATSNTGIDMASWGGNGGQAGDMGYMGLNLPLFIYPRIAGFDIIIGLVTVLFTSLVACIWPSWVAGKLEPMEAMRA